MRLRAGLVVCLYAVFIGVGCRQALVPQVDTNVPPETWITAAPQDTITTKDANGQVEGLGPQAGTIPVIFHLYWAGSDQDGEVVGYYYAVVETTTTIPVGGIKPPRLPGPKPRDYHYTTRTDTTFIFNVSETSPDREHAFYIYAVDNKGLPDPTPARFIFVANDHHIPTPVIDESSALGHVFRQDAMGRLFTKDTTYNITDDGTDTSVPTKDFVPVGSQLTFRWHAELESPLLVPIAWKYKLDESSFVTVDSSVSQVVYPFNKTGPGTKRFTLKVIDQAGGARPVERRFQVNLPPDTWWSGPDPSSPIWSTRPTHPFSTTQLKYYAVSDWNNLPQITGSLLSCDSLQVLPADRPFHRTFMEIWKDTIYVRAEGDTVHMNSFVVLGNGGFDEDSPYAINVQPLEQKLAQDTVQCTSLPPIVVHPGPPNGSPVGFRAFVGTYLDPAGPFSRPSITGLYPVFDPTSFRYKAAINSYQSAIQSGKAYATVRAQDGTGQDLGGVDNTVSSNLKPWVDNIDRGGGDPTDVLNRYKKVMTFVVNYSPFLLTSSPAFSPKLSVNGPDTLATRQVNINLLADDIDPLDPSAPNVVGGPTSNKIFRFTVSFKGKNAAGRGTTISPADLFRLPAINVPVYPIPSDIVSQAVTLTVELCDCRECEQQAGRGRCVYQDFPLFVPPPAPRTSALETSTHSGPGFSSAMSRSNAP